jgi:hypothetical protein
MRTPHFHMPHMHRAHSGAAEPHPHHPHHPMAYQMRRLEGVVDYMMVGGIVALAAAMVYGLITASGRAPWF